MYSLDILPCPDRFCGWLDDGAGKSWCLIARSGPPQSRSALGVIEPLSAVGALQSLLFRCALTLRAPATAHQAATRRVLRVDVAVQSFDLWLTIDGTLKCVPPDILYTSRVSRTATALAERWAGQPIPVAFSFDRPHRRIHARPALARAREANGLARLDDGLTLQAASASVAAVALTHGPAVPTTFSAAGPHDASIANRDAVHAPGGWAAEQADLWIAEAT